MRQSGKQNKTLSLLLAGIALLVVGCGGNKTNSAAAPAAGANSGPAILSNNLTDVTPGTPIAQSSNQNVLLQTMVKNLSGNGSATVSAQTESDYLLDSSNASGTSSGLRQLNTSNTAVTSPNAIFYGQVSGNSILVQLYFQDQGWVTFYFVPIVNVYGINLNSTDRVALFLSSDNASLLKVSYQSPNPSLLYFSLQLTGVNQGGGYGNNNPSQSMHVISRSLVTSLKY